MPAIDPRHPENIDISLTTARLVVRTLREGDAEAIHRYASAREIAATTLNIPHPYPPEAAPLFIASARDAMQRGESLVCAITHEGELMGCIGLRIDAMHNRAEMGYWIGKPFWGQGYTSEAAQRLVAYGFDTLQLNRVYATCLSHNVASARVMQKAGMTYEGRLREHIVKWGVAHDLDCYGITRADYFHLKN